MYTTQAPLTVVFLIVFIVLGLIIGSFIITFIRHQRFVTHLRQSKIEAEITTLENERKRIATDFHDELGPLLSAAKLKYSEAETMPGQEQIINDGHKLIDDAIKKMRLIATELIPSTLLYKGMAFAVNDFINQVSPRANLKISFVISEQLQLNPFQSLHIYRILMEIMHNTIKHAAASTLKIVLYVEKDMLHITTIDNGKGFNYKSMLKKRTGLGLYSIQSRTDILNGILRIKSKIDKGTSFHISIPLKNSNILYEKKPGSDKNSDR
ncbi:MAG: ATP-binding protein [Ferruginibacter sp.]